MTSKLEQRKIDPREAKWELEKMIKAFIIIAKDDVKEQKELLKSAETAPRPTQ